jgi:hypothetical protein
MKHTKGYLNLKNYTLFISLDICKKNPYLKPNMFWHLGEKKGKYDLNFVSSIN